MILRFFLFLIINFGALALGGFFTADGVASTWYAELNKAPWTPPGWVFGAAWTFIMICFAFYMAFVSKLEMNSKKIIGLFILQWILNVAWNPTFFYFHNAIVGLVVIIALTLLIGYLLFHYWSKLQLKTTFILPYFIWLLIATSLNAYIVVMN